MTAIPSIDAFLADYNAMRERAEIAEQRCAELADAILRQSPTAIAARLSNALDSLKALERQLAKIGGYATHEQQAEIREARAVLAECGR